MSGRGVGVDVVMTRIRALGGAVELVSEPGQGTTFVLRLPLTLAIVRALLAQVGAERYVAAAHLRERDGRVRRRRRSPRWAIARRWCCATRWCRRCTCAGCSASSRGDHAGPAARCWCWRWGSAAAALVVDALLGQQEIVVEPFDAPRGMPPAVQRGHDPRGRRAGADPGRRGPRLGRVEHGRRADLKELQLDALREVANIGAGHAATALSQMTNQHDHDQRAARSTCARSRRWPSCSAIADAVVAAVLMHMMGDLTGRTLLLFPERVGHAPLRHPAAARRRAPRTEFGAMEQSGAQGGRQHPRERLPERAQRLHGDDAGAVGAEPGGRPSRPRCSPPTYLNFGHDRDFVFCVETEFQVEGASEQLHGHFLLLPDLPSLRAIFDAIRVA